MAKRDSTAKRKAPAKKKATEHSEAHRDVLLRQVGHAKWWVIYDDSRGWYIDKKQRPGY